MRRRPNALLSAATLLGVGVATAPAVAQVDIAPPKSNVLLLIDSSGSMEYQSGFNQSGEDVYPHCDPTDTNTADDATTILPCPNDEKIYRSGTAIDCRPNERSRWIDLVEVLTGDIINYRCEALARTAGTFQSIYEINGLTPYDIGYSNPYHRPISFFEPPSASSEMCVPAPGSYPATVSAPYGGPMTDASVVWRPLGSPNSLCSSQSETDFQVDNGLLDIFASRVRFGLMTFDTLQDPGTGVSDVSNGMDGAWSYYAGYQSGGGHIQGRPDGCSQWSDMEVGARNPFAPPWEGRMIGFGPTSDSELLSRSGWIQDVLLATRPFGATPIAGMLADAYEYLYNDDTDDPASPGNPIGPALATASADPYADGGCRGNYIILLTDGEPNLDLRGYCTGINPPGNCPFDEPQNTTALLASQSVPTKTFVIGFSMPSADVSGTEKDCATLDMATDCTDAAIAASSTPRALRACCTLNEIAIAGQTPPDEAGNYHALFAADRVGLRATLKEVFDKISASTTTRTLPVFATSSIGGGEAFRFRTAFQPEAGLYRGAIKRERWECNAVSGVAEPVPVNENEGDDFVANVNAGGPNVRKLYSVNVEDLGGGSYDAGRSVRPNRPVAVADGVGTYSGNQYGGSPTEFVSHSFPTSLGITGSNCSMTDDNACRDRIVKWWVGLGDNGTGYPRCASPETCNLIADIFHSTPAVIGPPSEMLPDETYGAFEVERHDRPLVLYTSTNDGFLHAFQVYPDVTTKENNELWAFAPPAVLPHVFTLSTPSWMLLLDGEPVVRDVIATRNASSYPVVHHAYERSPSETLTNLTWRTALVQSFGNSASGVPVGGGYFAVDVTEPRPDESDPGTGELGGPQFLWQLTSTESDVPLFGSAGGTPLITTLYFSDNGSPDSAREVAVAVLPGGVESASTATAACTGPSEDPTTLDQDDDYPLRGSVRCWGPAPDYLTPARSLTIVRLDSGEVIKSFRPQLDGDELPGLPVTNTPLVAPITGRPAAFPGGAGAIADRLYVGDAEGILWRVDVSAIDPDDWKMVPFLDAYNPNPNVNPAPGEVGQPIVMAPVLSTDTNSDVIVLFATGDQDNLTEDANMLNFVYSVREHWDGDTQKHTTEVIWFEKLTGGERVMGPLQLFNGEVFFSSFIPAGSSAGACATGTSKVWGLDYNTPETGTSANSGGRPVLVIGGASPVPFIESGQGPLDADATVFGVSIGRVPTCSSQSVETDVFMGGSHTTMTNVNPGRFQLVMHTNVPNDAVTTANPFTSIDLPTPAMGAIVQSWAAIVE